MITEKNMKEWNAQFSVVEGIQFYYEKEGETVLRAIHDGGQLCVSMLFDVRDVPLCLCAEAAVGDTARIVFRPYRVELYVNEVLCDEEWPYGSACWTSSVRVAGAAELSLLPMPDAECQMSVTGTFVNAEGWRPGGGVFVGDCMPYEDDGRYHVLYLKDRHHHHSKWGLGAHQWAHISTEDFITWQMHPMAVEIDDPMEGSICTGSHVRVGDVHYLYYTVRTSDGSPAPIRRSVSQDGYHFEKDRDFGFTLSARYHGASARDPKVVCAEDGTYHMFVTTSDLALNRGVLAHLISYDGDRWEECGNIYESLDESQPECPDYFTAGGTYYLVFSHYGRAHYLYSDKPFTDWIVPENSKIDGVTVPKAAVHNGRILFTGFHGDGGYAGTMTFFEAVRKEDGTLCFDPGE